MLALPILNLNYLHNMHTNAPFLRLPFLHKSSHIRFGGKFSIEPTSGYHFACVFHAICLDGLKLLLRVELCRSEI